MKQYKDQKHMRRTENLDDHQDIKGYDFEKKFDLQKFLKSYNTTGFQATNLGIAIDIANEIATKRPTTYLSFTGNAISSGLREIITYLVKNKHVDIIITSASGVEEDVIKSLATFKVGNFQIPGRILFENGIGRIGNIFVPNQRYLHFERFMQPIFETLHEKKIVTPTFITNLIGSKLKEDSYLYWAYKNNIPVYCPGIIDGSLGDLTYFFNQKKPIQIDVVQDHKKLIDYTLNQDKTAAIMLGGGIPKHYSLNSNIFKEGFDYAIYLTTASEHHGSDSGGNEEEAKTWAKLKLDSKHVKVVADFTITFPLIIAGSYMQKKFK
ncbi:MAG: deoxyhypusine synthase [Candidatus Woesearchaeota archaeon]